MRYLVLQNGRVFAGEGFGANGDVEGELVFTTGMSGYVETLTDPSYFDQIVVQTFPLIGDYGVMPEDAESAGPRLKGYVVREWCETPSNYRAQGDIDAYLKREGVPGLCGVDTRALTRQLRDAGVMRAALLNELPKDMDGLLKQLNSRENPAGVAEVTCKEIVKHPVENARYRVALWDFGTKLGIVRELNQRGCEVFRIPAFYTAEQILACNPDGIMLSNGPGDPLANPGVIAEMQKLCLAKKPTFGICLGHQLLALSQGAKTEKMKFGHRGENQPVRDTETNRHYITSQNHGYALLNESLPKGARPSYVNANDGTNEGIAYDYMPAFTVQFHPEACGGPLDTGFLFDKFMSSMEVCACR